ncbi:MAG: hypothetical protein AB2392_16295 [Neobacillus sp.]
MKQNQQDNDHFDSIIEPGFAGTDAQKVKQEFRKDVNQGKGAMTSREAGSMQE